MATLCCASRTRRCTVPSRPAATAFQPDLNFSLAEQACPQPAGTAPSSPKRATTKSKSSKTMSTSRRRRSSANTCRPARTPASVHGRARPVITAWPWTARSTTTPPGTTRRRPTPPGRSRTTWPSGAASTCSADAMALSAKPYLQRITAHIDENIARDQHPYNVASLRWLDSIDFHADVTFFIGENGAGKSTLLEAIAMVLGYSMEGGTKGVQLNSAREAAPLHAALRLSKSYKAPRDGYFFSGRKFFQRRHLYGRSALPGRLRRQVAARAVARR